MSTYVHRSNDLEMRHARLRNQTLAKPHAQSSYLHLFDADAHQKLNRTHHPSRRRRRNKGYIRLLIASCSSRLSKGVMGFKGKGNG